MKKTVLGLCLTATALILAIPLPALAERGYDRGGYHRHENNRYYGRHTERQWHSGRWHHGSYSGRIGWWWIVDGLYYPYTQRSNAYPVYQETVVIEQPVPQPTIIVQQPVQMQPQYSTGVAPQPSTNLWYYCDASRMYYPYVNTCASGWRAVPATPPTGVIR